MLGLGETFEEICEVLEDANKIPVDIITIGQYLAPSKEHCKVIKEYSEEEFKNIGLYAKKIGVKSAACGRYVRSSYLAEENFKEIKS